MCRHGTILEIAPSSEGKGRGGISITLKHRVCLLEWFSVAAGKGGGSWRGKERACFSVIENRACCLVGEAREEGRGRVASLSLLGFLPWFVISSLSRFLQLIWALRSRNLFWCYRFCSRFYSPDFFLPFFRLTFFSFSRWNLEMRLSWNLERWNSSV